MNEIKDKSILYKDDDYIIVDYTIEDELEDSLFDIENDLGKKTIGIQAFVNGLATTDDEYLNSLISQLKDNKKEFGKNPEFEETPKLSQREQGIKDAREDFFAQPQKKEYFKKLEKEFYNNNFTEYEKAYYEEFKRLKNSKVANKQRTTTETVSNTYPGDVDELIDWLKDAITAIDILSGDQSMDNAKEFATEFNNKYGTSYEVQYAPTKYATSFVASLTDKEEILNKMPEEVKEWKVKKNIGRLKQYAYDKVYNETSNSLASNSIVFDLLDTYGFNLGKQKKKEEK